MGVIESAWGGTPVEAWTRMAALGEDAAVTPLFTLWGKVTEREPDAQLFAANKQRLIDEAKAAGKPAPAFPWPADLNSWGPGVLYNGMIAPLTPLAYSMRRSWDYSGRAYRSGRSPASAAWAARLYAALSARGQIADFLAEVHRRIAILFQNASTKLRQACGEGRHREHSDGSPNQAESNGHYYRDLLCAKGREEGGSCHNCLRAVGRNRRCNNRPSCFRMGCGTD